MTDETLKNKDKAQIKQKLDSRLVLIILFSFFAIIFAINFIYIYLAQKTWRGVYTQNGYQKGLEYNKTLDEVKTQKKLGWSFNINYSNTQNNTGKLVVCLMDRNKNQIKDAKLLVKIMRPTQEGYDFTQNLMPQNGCYFSIINFPLKGQWVLEIQAFKDNNILQEVKKYVVQ